MSELDPQKEPHKDTSESDEELESLSAEEKAAFEKIMAEIAAVSGGAPPEGTDDAHNDREIGPQPEPLPEKSADSAAALSDDLADEPDPQVPDAPSADQNTVGKQAELDQITSAIDTNRETGAVSPAGDEENPSLSDDQQASLDQIMAEIESKRKGEKKEIAPDPSAQEDADLSGDQKAALDQIMAEIESKRSGENKPAAPQATDDDESADLSDDQQAALDQIMAEIESKRSAGKDVEEEANAAAGAASDDDPTVDMERIMADIDTRKSAKTVSATGLEDSEAVEDEKRSLTMEEFDDELNHLLSEAKEMKTAPATDDPKAQPPKQGDRRPVSGQATSIKADSAVAPVVDGPVSGPSEGLKKNKEYPILQEIPAESEPRNKAAGLLAARWLRRPAGSWRVALTAVLIAAAVSGGSFWAYRNWRSAPAHVPSETLNDTPRAAIETSAVHEPEPVVKAGVAAALPNSESAMPGTVTESKTPGMLLADVAQQLTAARDRIQQKIADIEQLKNFYIRGINEEVEKIEEGLNNGRIPSLAEALADSQTELGLRAIQRRKTYIAKLETPLTQLGAMSEELLYLQRRTKLYDILNGGIVGLPIEAFREDAMSAVASYLQYHARLSVDDVDVPTPSLAAIWEDLVSQLERKANLLARRAPLNRTISAEICNGTYDRNHQLTALSEEAAACLVKWPGKDMYLNGLTELTPEATRVLIQWPGEWLSLNGLKELSPETARYLSQWPGQRLSLNGLSSLSQEATEHLSQWRGKQLEMVGLRSIGSWKNYGTRLFLSEKLRRQLEVQ